MQDHVYTFGEKPIFDDGVPSAGGLFYSVLYNLLVVFLLTGVIVGTFVSLLFCCCHCIIMIEDVFWVFWKHTFDRITGKISVWNSYPPHGGLFWLQFELCTLFCGPQSNVVSCIVNSLTAHGATLSDGFLPSLIPLHRCRSQYRHPGI